MTFPSHSPRADVSPDADARASNPHAGPAPLAHLIGRTRFVVILAVLAVLLVALSLFLLGSIYAGMSVWKAWAGLAHGHRELPRPRAAEAPWVKSNPGTGEVHGQSLTRF